MHNRKPTGPLDPSQPMPPNTGVSGGPSWFANKKSLWKALCMPLCMYSVLMLIYGYKYKAGFSLKSGSLFSWHPFLMVLGFITMAGNAALIKKTKGLENTLIHGNLMSGAIIAAFLGWYAIYDTKVSFNRLKDFNEKSLHGQLGIAVMIGYLFVGIGGFVALHPTYGMDSLKSSTTFRMFHRLIGRSLTALAWYSCVLGARSATLMLGIPNDSFSYAYVEAPLLIMGFLTLL